MKACKTSAKRQDNWKKYPYLFNQCKNLVFQCQCGKKYESFPGLYLHFQRKHGQKISTKFNASQCRVVQDQERIIYKYILGEKREKQDEELCAETNQTEKGEISTVLSKFMEDKCEALLDLPIFRVDSKSKDFIADIMDQLEKYIFEDLEVNWKKLSTKKVLFQIPNYLNGFAQQRVIDQTPTEYSQICIVLFYLAQWLRKYHYTNLILQFSSETEQP